MWIIPCTHSVPTTREWNSIFGKERNTSSSISIRKPNMCNRLFGSAEGPSIKVIKHAEFPSYGPANFVVYLLCVQSQTVPLDQKQQQSSTIFHEPTLPRLLCYIRTIGTYLYLFLLVLYVYSLFARTRRTTLTISHFFCIYTRTACTNMQKENGSPFYHKALTSTFCDKKLFYSHRHFVHI